MGDLNLWLVAAAILVAIMLVVLILHLVGKRLLKRASRNIKISTPEVAKGSKKLKLFLLEREGGKHGDIRRFIIAAEDEKSARRIAEKEGIDYQHPELWLKQASCEEIGVASPDIQVGIVLRDILEV